VVEIDKNLGQLQKYGVSKVIFIKTFNKNIANIRDYNVYCKIVITETKNVNIGNASKQNLLTLIPRSVLVIASSRACRSRGFAEPESFSETICSFSCCKSSCTYKFNSNFYGKEKVICYSVAFQLVSSNGYLNPRILQIFCSCLIANHLQKNLFC